MAKWLERAKREIPKSAGPATAIAAETSPTTVTAVRGVAECSTGDLSIGSNGRCLSALEHEIDARCVSRLTLIRSGDLRFADLLTADARVAEVREAMVMSRPLLNGVG